MNNHRNTLEPWEEILGLKTRQNWGRDLRECVTHLAQGWGGMRTNREGGRPPAEATRLTGTGMRGGRPLRATESGEEGRTPYVFWRTTARQGRNPRQPDGEAGDARPTCRPAAWRKTWAATAPQLWNDPGAGGALQCLHRACPEGSREHWQLRTQACTVWGGIRRGRHRGIGRCSCLKQCQHWQDAHHPDRHVGRTGQGEEENAPRPRTPPTLTPSNANDSVPAGGRRFSSSNEADGEHCRQEDDWGGDDNQRNIWKTLSMAASTLIRLERGHHRGPREEAKGRMRWNDWAAGWQAKWIPKVYGPPTRERRRHEATADKKTLYRAALKIMNVLRARNQFGWLVTQVALGKHKRKTVSKEHWSQVVWTAHVILAAEGHTDRGQREFIPREIQRTLQGYELIRPYYSRGDGDDFRTEGAWVYSLRTMNGRRTYLGATDRVCHRHQKESSPGERWMEHMRRGWWRSQGYKTGKGDIPMYKMTARWRHGFGELVMIPLVTTRRTCETSQAATGGQPTGTRSRRKQEHGTTRSKLLALEAALQRKWKPGYVAAWSGRRCRTSALAYINPETGEDADERYDGGTEPHLTELPRLMHPNGRQWDPSTEWEVQFQRNTLRLDNKGKWTSEICDRMMWKLSRHGKQATAAYGVLRRAGTRNLARIWSWAAMAGRKVENVVWTHIQRAMHGRVTQIQRARPQLRVIEGSKAATVPLVQQAWKIVQKQETDMLQTIRTVRTRQKKVIDIIRTDIQWQGRLGPETRCQCDLMDKWIKEEWGIHQDMPRHEGHGWTTLDWLMEHAPEDAGANITRTQRWIAGIRRGDMDTPILATQPIQDDDSKVIQEAARVTTRMAMTQLGTDRWNHGDGNTLRAAIKGAMHRMVQEGHGKGKQIEQREGDAQNETNETPQTDDIRRYLRKTWLVCSPLDKGKHRARYVCPVAAWKELERESIKYCWIGPYTSTPEACEIQTAWLEANNELYQRWKATGMPPPGTKATLATCRTAPKSKDPMRKGRLLVGTHVTPGRKQAGIVTKAAEFLPAIAYQDGAGRNQTVESVGQVRDAIEAMTREMRQACREGHNKVTMRKYDFVAFFQEVRRTAVEKSIAFWIETVRRQNPGKTAVRIDPDARNIFGSRHPRESVWRPGAGFLKGNAECELVRGGGRTAERTYKIPFAAMPEYLGMDGEILIEIGQKIGRQEEGLTIGSAWGGAGAKIWATHRELLQEHQGMLQPRKQQCEWCNTRHIHTYETLAHGSQGAQVRTMRWVDDRWGVISGCCDTAIRWMSRVEYLRYTGLEPTTREVLARLWPVDATHDDSDAGWQEAVTTVLSYLGHFIQQTREEVSTVVGMDVALLKGDGTPIGPPPHWGSTAQVTETCTLVSRPNTKDVQLTEGGRIELTKLKQPRFTPRRMTATSAATVRHLAATMVRFADLMCPTWDTTFTPNEELLRWWAVPWKALYRELRANGWHSRVWVEASSLVARQWSDTRPPHVQHRFNVIDAMTWRVREDGWGDLGMGDRARTGPGQGGAPSDQDRDGQEDGDEAEQDTDEDGRQATPEYGPRDEDATGLQETTDPEQEQEEGQGTVETTHKAPDQGDSRERRADGKRERAEMKKEERKRDYGISVERGTGKDQGEGTRERRTSGKGKRGKGRYGRQQEQKGEGEEGRKVVKKRRRKTKKRQKERERTREEDKKGPEGWKGDGDPLPRPTSNDDAPQHRDTPRRYGARRTSHQAYHHTWTYRNENSPHATEGREHLPDTDTRHTTKHNPSRTNTTGGHPRHCTEPREHPRQLDEAVWMRTTTRRRTAQRGKITDERTKHTKDDARTRLHARASMPQEAARQANPPGPQDDQAADHKTTHEVAPEDLVSAWWYRMDREASGERSARRDREQHASTYFPIGQFTDPPEGRWPMCTASTTPQYAAPMEEIKDINISSLRILQLSFRLSVVAVSRPRADHRIKTEPGIRSEEEYDDTPGNRSENKPPMPSEADENMANDKPTAEVVKRCSRSAVSVVLAVLLGRTVLPLAFAIACVVNLHPTYGDVGG